MIHARARNAHYVSIKRVLVLAIALISVFIKLQPNEELDWELVQDLARNYSMQIRSSSVSEVDNRNINIDKESPLKGVVVVITGATSGIGKSLVLTVYRLGATVIAIGRSSTKLSQLQEELLVSGQNHKKTYFDHKIFTVKSQFSDLESVSDAAKEIISKFSSIDILINNAAINCFPDSTATATETDQGYDLCFGVNYISHVLLTEKLTPLLRKSNLKSPRIIQISSSLHWLVDETELIATSTNDYLPIAAKSSSTKTPSSSSRSYANSKLAQILYGRALDRKLQSLTSLSMDRNNAIKVISVSPGLVHTNIFKKKLGQYYMKIFGYPSNGIGIMSIINAMFRLNIIHINDAFLTNTNVNEYIYSSLPTSKWSSRVGLRDVSVKLFSVFYLTMWQKFLYNPFQISKSSPESYNVTAQDNLYTWSINALDKWLD